MTSDELFSTEESIIRRGEEMLESPDLMGNPLRDEYEYLLKNYKKMYKQLSRLIKITDKQQSKLSQANTILEMHSKYDELTGIYNRRVFNEMFEREWRRSIRYRHILSLLMFDIDHFKNVNDMHGHQAGDELLKLTAQKIQGVARREGDLASRYGGEEFILLLPDTVSINAFKLAESLRKDISKTVIHYDNKDIKITISAGLASMIPDINGNPDRLIRRADEALYMAKRTGRNRVCIYDDVRTEGADHVG